MKPQGQGGKRPVYTATAFQVLRGRRELTLTSGSHEVSCLNPQRDFKDLKWPSECHAAELPFRLSNSHLEGPCGLARLCWRGIRVEADSRLSSEPPGQTVTTHKSALNSSQTQHKRMPRGMGSTQTTTRGWGRLKAEKQTQSRCLHSPRLTAED